MTIFQKLRIEPFVLAILAAVLLASAAPAQSIGAVILHWLTTAAIALLFFMHGAKPSRQAILAGISHWRQHLLIFTATFIFFPLLGLLLQLLPTSSLPADLLPGFIFLCAMPATVQSAIAFTSTAGGNAAAAVCSASFSSLLGIVLSPIILSAVLNINGSQAIDFKNGAAKICLQLLLPFILGHLARPIIGKWLDAHRKLIKLTDSSSIILIVYTAFSAAVLEGLWHKVSAGAIIKMLLLCCLILTAALSFTAYSARLFKFKREDEITIVFCGSKKSLANGVPMANILFPAPQAGLMILPLMIFHQIQLMACSIIAGHYAKTPRP